MRNKILAVDDEINILTLLRMNLEMHDFDVVTAVSGKEALDLAFSESPNLILLDLMLPDIDGMTICKRLKNNQKTKDIPVVMLTALADESEKVKGLDSGADYYLTKPFGIRELMAVIRSVLRRQGNAVEMPGIVEVDQLTIDQDRMKMRYRSSETDLTHMELKLLTYLIDHQGKVLERKTIVEALTTKQSTTDFRSIDVHIWNIRKKLNDIAPGEEFIDTIRGVGYRFRQALS